MALLVQSFISFFIDLGCLLIEDSKLFNEVLAMVNPARSTVRSGNAAQSTDAPTTATTSPQIIIEYLGCYNDENRTWPTSGNDTGKATMLQNINSPAK